MDGNAQALVRLTSGRAIEPLMTGCITTSEKNLLGYWSEGDSDFFVERDLFTGLGERVKLLQYRREIDKYFHLSNHLAGTGAFTCGV